MTLFHRHRWIPVAVDNSLMQKDPNRLGARERPATAVLRRCRCGDATTIILPGTWTKQDVGVNDEAVGDLMKILHLTAKDEDE